MSENGPVVEQPALSDTVDRDADRAGPRTPGARMAPTPAPGRSVRRGKQATEARAMPEVTPAWRGPLNLLAFIRWATTDPEAAAIEAWLQQAHTPQGRGACAPAEMAQPC